MSTHPNIEKIVIVRNTETGEEWPAAIGHETHNGLPVLWWFAHKRGKARMTKPVHLPRHLVIVRDVTKARDVATFLDAVKLIGGEA